jgi:hypothetical protein
VDAAERQFARADFVFPGHPYAGSGRARVLLARGRYRDAYLLLARGPDTPETLAIRGDIARHLGDVTAARIAYRETERLERDGWKEEEPQPAALARFLAERRLDPDAALSLARAAAGTRQDIHTLDALAWATFRKGELELAAKSIAGALRTGTVDPRIRCHADAIAAALRARTTSAIEPCDPLELHAQAAVARTAQSGRAVEP